MNSSLLDAGSQRPFSIIVKRYFLALAISTLLELPRVWAAIYYVSPGGNDSNSGTSQNQPWKTIDRVNQGPSGGYQSGDSILFEGGQTFSGTIGFSSANYRANSASALSVSSYGSGRATVDSGSGPAGLALAAVGGLRISNIRFIGTAPSGTTLGIGITNDSTSTLSGFTLSDLEISGYTFAVYVSTGKAPSKIQSIRLERVVAHGNANGPALFGNYTTPAAANSNFYAIDGVYIGHCQIYNNTGFGLSELGSGIVAMNVDNITIEHNKVYNNGGQSPFPSTEEGNGLSAVTVWDGRNALIQHNEIYGQRYSLRNETDNAGLDLWALDSTVQYNYIHDNEGWGLTLGAGHPTLGVPLNNWPSERNVLRYNIVANNGRLVSGTQATRPIMLANIFLFGPVKDFEIYNNTLYGSEAPSATGELRQAMLWLKAVPSEGDWNNIRIRNNIFLASGDVSYIEVSEPQTGSVLIQGNNYYGSSSQKHVVWGASTYGSVSTWSQQTGQEQLNGSFIAVLENPSFCGPVPGSNADSFKLQNNSPLLNRGLDLRSNFGLNVGTRDYFGDPLPSTAFDIGADEFVSGQICGTLVSSSAISDLSRVVANPNPLRHGDMGTAISNLPSDQSLEIYNQLGQRVRRFDPAAAVFWDGRDDRGDLVPNGVYSMAVKGRKLSKLGVVR